MDSQSTANFEVEKCNYRYDLNIHSYYFGDVLDMEVVIKSSGLLTVPDPSHPRQAEGFMKRVTYDGSFTRFPPECTLSTYNTDHAEGLVDVKTVETDAMGGVNLIIGTPQAFTALHSVVITCDGQSHPQVLSIPVNITEDPWISEKFSAGRGFEKYRSPLYSGWYRRPVWVQLLLFRHSQINEGGSQMNANKWLTKVIGIIALLLVTLSCSSDIQSATKNAGNIS